MSFARSRSEVESTGLIHKFQWMPLVRSPRGSPSWIRSSSLEGDQRLKNTSLPRLIASGALLAALLTPTVTLQAQQSQKSYLRDVPNNAERDDPRVQSIIERAENHYKLGELNLKDGKRQPAREEFDRAVDSVLESGMDVRSNPRLQRYYLELVERVYRMEVPQGVPAPQQGGGQFVEVAQSGQQTGTPAPPQVGFVEQKFEPSNLDELSKLVLTKDEEKISDEQVEDAWRPTARSWAAASGLWQFIPGTGSRFGLRQTAYIDERNSFEKATRASAQYLKWLARRYNGNWELAMGAYNTGEGNVDRAIGRAGAADFWTIYPYIAQETRNYVPNILAVILIAKNPEKYGFRNVQRMSPLAYDTVSVPSATSLRLIAEATDTSLDHIQSLNPELKRDTTPRGEAFTVRV